MIKYEDNVSARLNGNNLQPLAGATVTVTNNATGLPATLYSDTVLTPLAQPLTTDNNGYFGFYAADGKYTLTFSGRRFATFTRQIVLDDPEDNVTVSVLGAEDGAGKVGYGQRTIEGKLGEIVSVKDAPFNAKGDGVADDTAAIQAASDFAAATQRSLFFPDGVYVCGRVGLADSDHHWHGVCATIAAKPGMYDGDTSPMLSGSFGMRLVRFSGLTFDQGRRNLTYPAGFSRSDANVASSWGGGTWLGVFDGGQEGTVEFLHCRLLGTFRGFLIKGQARAAAIHCTVDARDSLGDCGFAAEFCANVEYNSNVLVARDWFNSGGTITGANGLFGNSCRNVVITNNQMTGFQLVFHASEPGSSDVGMGRRCIVSNNTIEFPPADTAFYRWAELVVSSNSISMSGDMGIAISSSSYATVIGNIIRGAHIGGIGITACQSVVVANNSVLDVAQNYAQINALGNRYAGNAGAWIAGITCDYQADGQKGVECVISGNSVGWTVLPPVSDAYGQVRANVRGIQIECTPNTASQSTFSITGNYVKADPENMPSHFVFAPSHRFYTADMLGTPKKGEVFTDGSGNSFVYLVDFGVGNLCFVKKLKGAIGAAVAFTGASSGAIIVSHNPAPQLTWLGITGGGNFDYTTTHENQHIGA